MKTKILVVRVSAILALVVVGLFISQRPSPPESKLKKAIPVPQAAVPPIAPPATITPPPKVAAPKEELPQATSPESAPPLTPKTASHAEIKSPIPPIRISPPKTSNDQDHRDPVARLALKLVGADPVAEEYWMEAINDPNLSPVEREGLISDLNEDGLSDIKHPTLEDLPLIMNRLWLIEKLAPDALDKVNAVAFKEAYDDLWNLAELTLGRGKPVD